MCDPIARRHHVHVTEFWQTNPQPSHNSTSSSFMTALRTAAVGIAVLSFIVFLITADPIAFTISSISLFITLALFLSDEYSSTHTALYTPQVTRRHYSYYHPPLQVVQPQIVPVPIPVSMAAPAMYMPPSTLFRTAQNYHSHTNAGFNPFERGTLRSRSN